MRVVGRGGVIVKERMVRNVVLFRYPSDIRFGAAETTGSPVRIYDRQIESAHETAPAYPIGFQQIADGLASHDYLVAGRAGANVALRIGIANHGQRSVGAAVHFECAECGGRSVAPRLAAQ